MNQQIFWSNLSWALGEKTYESIEDLDIPSHVPTFLLYNTNDLCLSEKQFNALIESIGPTEKIYVAQNYPEEIREFDFPLSYSDYQSQYLLPMTYLTSNKFDWLVIIDEALESGVGVLLAKSDAIIDNYSSRYKNGIKDIQNLIEFHYRDASRNPYAMDNLITILSLWHGSRTGDSSICEIVPR